MNWHFADLIERTQAREAKFVVIGQGVVGLPIALRTARAGLTVVGFDFSPTRTAALSAGGSAIAGVTDADVVAGLAAGYEATSDPSRLADFDIAVIAAPTSSEPGSDDLSFFSQAAVLLLPHARRGTCVVLERTLFPGTAIAVLETVFQGAGLGSREVAIDYAPNSAAWQDGSGITPDVAPALPPWAARADAIDPDTDGVIDAVLAVLAALAADPARPTGPTRPDPTGRG